MALLYLALPALLILLLAAAVGAGCAYWASGSWPRRAGMGCLGSTAFVLLPLAVLFVPPLLLR